MGGLDIKWALSEQYVASCTMGHLSDNNKKSLECQWQPVAQDAQDAQEVCMLTLSTSLQHVKHTNTERERETNIERERERVTRPRSQAARLGTS